MKVRDWTMNGQHLTDGDIDARWNDDDSRASESVRFVGMPE